MRRIVFSLKQEVFDSTSASCRSQGRILGHDLPRVGQDFQTRPRSDTAREFKYEDVEEDEGGKEELLELAAGEVANGNLEKLLRHPPGAAARATHYGVGGGRNLAVKSLHVSAHQRTSEFLVCDEPVCTDVDKGESTMKLFSREYRGARSRAEAARRGPWRRR